MPPRYFINRQNRHARIGYGERFAEMMLAQEMEEVSQEEFERFRTEGRNWYARQVAS